MGVVMCSLGVVMYSLSVVMCSLSSIDMVKVIFAFDLCLCSEVGSD